MRNEKNNKKKRKKRYYFDWHSSIICIYWNVLIWHLYLPQVMQQLALAIIGIPSYSSLPQSFIIKDDSIFNHNKLEMDWSQWSIHHSNTLDRGNYSYFIYFLVHEVNIQRLIIFHRPANPSWCSSVNYSSTSTSHWEEFLGCWCWH